MIMEIAGDTARISEAETTDKETEEVEAVKAVDKVADSTGTTGISKRDIDLISLISNHLNRKRQWSFHPNPFCRS
jgi:hypothetical protein